MEPHAEAIPGINVIQDPLAIDLDQNVIPAGNEVQMEPLIVLNMVLSNLGKMKEIARVGIPPALCCSLPMTWTS